MSHAFLISRTLKMSGSNFQFQILHFIKYKNIESYFKVFGARMDNCHNDTTTTRILYYGAREVIFDKGMKEKKQRKMKWICCPKKKHSSVYNNWNERLTINQFLFWNPLDPNSNLFIYSSVINFYLLNDLTHRIHTHTHTNSHFISKYNWIESKFFIFIAMNISEPFKSINIDCLCVSEYICLSNRVAWSL